MEPYSCRRFELGLPLLGGLDLGTIMKAQSELVKGNIAGLASFIEAMGKSGEIKALRKISAIWTASDIELEMAERDLHAMEALEERAASRPFLAAFQSALDFQLALFDALGVQISSVPAAVTEPAPKKNARVRKAVSADSPSDESLPQ